MEDTLKIIKEQTLQLTAEIANMARLLANTEKVKSMTPQEALRHFADWIDDTNRKMKDKE